MKKITAICMFLTVFTASFALGADYLDTICWIDGEGDILELAVSTVSGGKSYTANGVYYHYEDDGDLISPVTGNLTYVGGPYVSGVVTIADRYGDVVIDAIGHVELNINTLDGDIWFAVRGTNVDTDEQDSFTAVHSLINISCP